MDKLRTALACLTIPTVIFAPHSNILGENWPSMYLDGPLLILITLLMLPFSREKRRLTGEHKNITLCWLGFIPVALLSWINANVFWGRHSPGDLFNATRYLYFAVLTFLPAVLVYRRAGLERVLTAGYITAFIAALFGIMQFFIADYGQLYALGYLPSGNVYPGRILSFHGSPNHLGVYLSTMLIIGTGSSFRGMNKKILYIPWALVLLTAIFLTRSRTALIVLALAYLFVSVIGKRSEIIPKVATGMLITFITFACLTVILPEGWVHMLLDPGNLYTRFENWENAFNKVIESPVLGLGPNPYPYLESVLIDNFYVYTGTLYGAAGLLLAGLMFIILFRSLRKISREQPEFKNLALGLQGALVVLLAANLTGEFFIIPKVAGPFFILTGGLLAAGKSP